MFQTTNQLYMFNICPSYFTPRVTHGLKDPTGSQATNVGQLEMLRQDMDVWWSDLEAPSFSRHCVWCSLYIYIYIYIYRERERESHSIGTKLIHIYIYIYSHYIIYIHNYIYNYMCSRRYKPLTLRSSSSRYSTGVFFLRGWTPGIQMKTIPRCSPHGAGIWTPTKLGELVGGFHVGK